MSVCLISYLWTFKWSCMARYNRRCALLSPSDPSDEPPAAEHGDSGEAMETAGRRRRQRGGDGHRGHASQTQDLCHQTSLENVVCRVPPNLQPHSSAHAQAGGWRVEQRPLGGWQFWSQDNFVVAHIVYFLSGQQLAWAHGTSSSLRRGRRHAANISNGTRIEYGWGGHWLERIRHVNMWWVRRLLVSLMSAWL